MHGPPSNLRRMGITATVPIEILYAAGRVPTDLNNVFVAGTSAEDVHTAENAGFPVNCCAWIKGIYGAARRLGIGEVVGVAQGDCSNTHALLEVWAAEGVRVHHFEYPYPRDRDRLAAALAAFAEGLGTTLDEAAAWKDGLDSIRGVLRRLDELTWTTGQVTGEENHLWLVGASDFGGDPNRYEADARGLLAEAETRPQRDPPIRLGFVGIPPICDGLYEFLDRAGAGVVFNEFQRQFAMLPPSDSLVEQYLGYTYPYGVAGRIADIRQEVSRRRIDGLVHYVQSFCYRHIQDRLLREGLDVPIVTLEFDRPGPLDGRSATRLEAFLEMIESRRRSGGPTS